MYHRKKPRRWRKLIAVIVLTILVIMVGTRWLQNNQDSLDNQIGHGEIISELTMPDSEPIKKDAHPYFPAIPGMTYNFAGEGMEYADFVRRVLFFEGNYVQIVDETIATSGGYVYELQPDRVVLVMSEPEEHDPTVNFLESLGEAITHQEIILQAPITVGQSWETAGKV